MGSLPLSLFLNRIFVDMRAGLAYIFMVLVSGFLASSPAFAVSAKSCQPARTTVVQTSSAIEQQRQSPHCDQLENTEVITAAFNQQTAFGPVVMNSLSGFKARTYQVVVSPLPAGRDNARRQPFYQLILFPFHGFW